MSVLTSKLHINTVSLEMNDINSSTQDELVPQLSTDDSVNIGMSSRTCNEFTRQYIFGRTIFIVDRRDGYVNASNFSVYNGKRLQCYALTTSYRSFKNHAFTYRRYRGDIVFCDETSGEEMSVTVSSAVTNKRKRVKRSSAVCDYGWERNCTIDRSKYYHMFLFIHFVHTEYDYAIFNDTFDFLRSYIIERNGFTILNRDNLAKREPMTSSCSSNDNGGDTDVTFVECNGTRIKMWTIFRNRTDTAVVSGAWISVSHYDDYRMDLYQLYENEFFERELKEVHGASCYKLYRDNDIYLRYVTFVHYLLWRKNYEDYLNLIPHLLTDFEDSRIKRIYESSLDSQADVSGESVKVDDSYTFSKSSPKFLNVDLRKARRQLKKSHERRLPTLNEPSKLFLDSSGSHRIHLPPPPLPSSSSSSLSLPQASSSTSIDMSYASSYFFSSDFLHYENTYSKILEDYCRFEADYVAANNVNQRNDEPSLRLQEIKAIDEEICTLKGDIVTSELAYLDEGTMKKTVATMEERTTVTEATSNDTWTRRSPVYPASISLSEVESRSLTFQEL